MKQYWPAGGLDLAGQEVHGVIVEAGSAAHLLSDEGELTAQTGHTATVSQFCIQSHNRAWLVQVLVFICSTWVLIYYICIYITVLDADVKCQKNIWKLKKLFSPQTSIKHLCARVMNIPSLQHKPGT